MSVWSSAGSVVRAQGELGLLNQEQLRITRQSNMVAQTRMKEKGGRVTEADDLKTETDNTYHGKESADYAFNAALAGAINAIFGAGFSIASAVKSGGVGNILSAVASSLTAVAAILNCFSAGAEVKSLEDKQKGLTTAYNDENKGVQAMDTNPIL